MFAENNQHGELRNNKVAAPQVGCSKASSLSSGERETVARGARRGGHLVGEADTE